MVTKKNNILLLEANENTIKTKIKDKKKKIGKKTKKAYYNDAFSIMDKFNNNSSFNNQNRITLEALKELVNDLETNIDLDSVYPELNDMDLNYKLFHKKEFYQYRIKKPEMKGNLEKNIDELSKKMCDLSGKRLLTNPQKLLRNYISPYTPYNGLLVYHGVGVGKTCTSISIAEGLKEIIKNNKKKIYILVNPSIKENFRNEILNTALIEKNIEEAKTKCTGEAYFKDEKIQKGKTKKKNMSLLVKNIISEYYEFVGYMEFASKVNKIIASVKLRNSSLKNTSEINKLIRKKIKEVFSDCMIIIDEAHNIANKSRDKDTKKEVLEEKLIEMESIMENSFEKEDVKGKDDPKLIGKIFTPIIKNVVRNAENLKLVLLTATPMYNEAFEIVDLINLLLLNDNMPLINQKDIFDSNNNIKESGKEILRKKINGYISYLRSENPLNFPHKIYPFMYEGRFIKGDLYPKINMKNEELGNNIINHLNVIGCEMKGLQWKVYKKYYYEEERTISFDINGCQISNIVFGEDLYTDEIYSSSNHYGQNIFTRALDFSKKNGVLSANINEEYRNNFDLDNLELISCKFHKFISGINRRIPDGILFLYSQFKPLGVYSLAIFLELSGVTNYGGKNILRNVKQKYHNGKPLKYLLKTGDSSKDFDNYKANDESKNSDGGIVKFILGTKAASEGINIYSVREIHIFDPWYHLNRVEQINGRGIRNCSHKLLELKNRNVTIYMYASIEPKESNKETVDLKMYKISEKKAINMGKIQEIVKSSSIDCYLNKEGNNYLGDIWEKKINIIDARGNKRDISLADKPFTDICNYSTEKKCEPLVCYGNRKVDENKILDESYRKEFSEKDIDYYTDLVKEVFGNTTYVRKFVKVVFLLEDILEYVTNNDKMNIDNKKDILQYTLNEIIKNETEILDSYKRKGYIIRKNNYYIFQPFDLPKDIPIVYRRMEYKKKINKVILKSLNLKKKSIIKSLKKEVSKKKIVSIKKNRDLDDCLVSFCRIALDSEMYFYKDNMESKNKNKNNMKAHLDFLEKEGFLRDIVIIEYQYDHLIMLEKETIIKFLISKIDTKYYDLIKDVVDLKNLKSNDLLYHLNQEIRKEFRKVNIAEEEELLDEKLNYLIKYCLYNHLEFNRNDGFERTMDKKYLGYRIYHSKTISRKVESKDFSYKYISKKFFNTSNQDKIVLDTYHKNYKLSKYQDRDFADIYGLYFCDRIRFKIVDNTVGDAVDKRTVKPGVGCENSATTNRKLLIPMMKTFKDGKRLLDDSTKQKYKCLIIELFLRYKEHLNQEKGGPLHFYNQGLHGLDINK